MASRPIKSRQPHWRFSCAICKDNHAILTCKTFINLNAEKRYDIVLLHHYCRNCLAASHTHEDCFSGNRCKYCNLRHHTALHGAPQLPSTKLSSNKQPAYPHITSVEEVSPIKAPVEEPQPMDSSSPSKGSSQPIQTKFLQCRVFVPTATLKVYKDSPNNCLTTRALINISAPISSITSSVVQFLQLQIIKEDGYDFVSLYIQPTATRSNRVIQIKALVTSDLPKKIYSSRMTSDPRIGLDKSSIADLDPCGNDMVHLEIGAEVFPVIRRDGCLMTDVGEVAAIPTALGYIFIGPTYD